MKVAESRRLYVHTYVRCIDTIFTLDHTQKFYNCTETKLKEIMRLIELFRKCTVLLCNSEHRHSVNCAMFNLERKRNASTRYS